MRWYPVFRAGVYPQMTVQPEELDGIVRNFTPGTFTPPLVIGHPKTDDPAWGWVSAVRRSGATLEVQFKDVHSAVEQLVNEGRYRQVSVRLRRGANGLELRHVGLLGATAPAVEGLTPISFEDGDAGSVTIEADFKEDHMPATREEIERELKAQLEADFAAREERMRAELQAERMKGRRRDVEAAVERVVTEGRLTPAQRDAGLVDFMLALDGKAEVEFAAGTKKTAMAWFEDFLATLPKVVEFKETAGRDTDPGAGVRVDFAAPGEKVDEKRLALHRKAVDYQRKNNCTYEAALDAVI